MKALKMFAPIFLILLLMSCDEDQTQTSLTGKWKLSESMMSIGTADAPWQKADNNIYISFNADGSIGGNYYNQPAQFVIIDSSKMEITLGNGTKTIKYYKLDGGSLELMGGCIEACGSRFRK